MSVEGGGISMSAPSIGPSIGSAISVSPVGPSFGPSLGGFSVPAMEGGFVGGPSISGAPFSTIVNEGPAPIGSLEGFSSLMPAPPDLGGTIGPANAINALNYSSIIAEPKPIFNIFNESPVTPAFLENTRPFGMADFYSFRPDRMGITVGIIKNPFLDLEDEHEIIPGRYAQEVKDIFAPANFVVTQPVVPMVRLKSLDFLTSAVASLIVPDVKIGFAEPLVKLEEGQETEAELARVRQTIYSLRRELNKGTRRLEAIKTKPLTELQLVEKMFEVVSKREEQEENTKPQVRESQRIELRRRILVRDENALAQRLMDAVKAVQQAFEKAGKEERVAVGGKDVRAHLPAEYAEVRSGVLKEDNENPVPDGSYLFEGVDIQNIGQIHSEVEMRAKVKETVNRNTPVRRSRGDDGEPVTQAEIGKVYLFRKMTPPVRQVMMRVIKKKEVGVDQKGQIKVSQTAYTDTGMTEEQRIEDDPSLREIFKIAA